MSNRLKKVTWIAIITLGLVGVLFASFADSKTDSAVSRERLLAAEIRCAECAGQSVAESSSKVAEGQREEIRRRISAGQSDNEIRQFFLDTYGSDIMTRPPGSGLGAAVWVLPVFAFVVGGAFVGSVFMRARKPQHNLEVTAEERDLVESLVIENSDERR